MLSLDLLFYSLKYLFAVVDSFCFTAQYEKKLRGLFLHFIDSNNPNKWFLLLLSADSRTFHDNLLWN